MSEGAIIAVAVVAVIVIVGLVVALPWLKERSRLREREHAEAELHAERAELHGQGLADDELVEDHERERFVGTSAVADRDTAWPDEPDPGAAWRERDRDLVVPHDERRRDASRTEDREPDTLHRRR